MYKPILLLISVVLIISAGWLTFFDRSHYGIHGDGFQCGEVKDTLTFYTAAAYYHSSQPLTGHGQALDIGTCPYQMYKARTYALDLWSPATLLGFIALRDDLTPRKQRIK
jgi:hypothetical protein